MSETVVRTHVRSTPHGGITGVRRHRRYLTTAQIDAGRGRGVGRAALSQELIRLGAAEGYAAAGPWEVERRGNDLTLLHYAFPIAKARYNESVGWEIGRLQGRPGYGMSASDRNGADLFIGTLRGYNEASREDRARVPRIGLNPDPRLRTKKYGGTYPSAQFGSRVSPYAKVDEKRTAWMRQVGIDRAAYSGAVSFPTRRGRRIRTPTR